MNSIISYNGIEIYMDDLYITIDRFLSDYNIPEEMLYKSHTFISLLSYIHDNLLNKVITRNNGINRNGYDYSLLDTIHRTIFLPVCGKYNHMPTLLSFSMLTGLSNETMSEVISGTYKDGTKVNEENSQTAKKWKRISEAANYDEISKGNVGAIFIGKASFGMTEAPQRLEIISNGTQATPEQIAEKYKGVERPEIPVFEEL